MKPIDPISPERLAALPRKGRLPRNVAPIDLEKAVGMGLDKNQSRPALTKRFWGWVRYRCRLARVQLAFRTGWGTRTRAGTGLSGWLLQQRLRLRLSFMRLRYRRLLSPTPPPPPRPERISPPQPLPHRLSGEVA